MSQNQFPGDPRSYEGTWDKLSQVAVKGAEYDSRERQPHPKCLEGTRVDLLNYIYGLLDNRETSRLIWLHGTAGVGKSAVAFNVAARMKGLKVTEQTNAEKRLAGTFFFSRKHTKRCTTGYFFATLVYQLATNFPSIREDVNQAIRENPALLDPDKSLHDQMEALFLKPLRRLRFRLCDCSPLVFIIDALDECTSKTELADLIFLLGQALREPDLPVTHILLTSRSEAHIREATQEEEVRPLVWEIPVQTSGQGVAATISLDGVDVDNDIYIFLEHSFRKLRSCCSNFPQPTGDQLVRLASRAGRRFIVASTMMKFIDDGYNDPRGRLQLMLNFTGELLPGTEVYKLYDRILATCSNPTRAYLHLSVVAALADPLPISEISKLLGPGQGKDVEKALAQLRSVMDVPTDGSLPVNIYHSSVRDYVSNPSNCSLPQVQHTISPHTLLAQSSFDLMMQVIPASTALLDALSKLKRHSQAMEPHDPHSLKDSLSFIIEPPRSLSIFVGLLWLRGDRSLDLQPWLNTRNGNAWLQSPGGAAWLQTRGGEDWLLTPGGTGWLQTQGEDWLQTQGGKDWLQTTRGRDWLQTTQGKQQTGSRWPCWRLEQSPSGWDWLQTSTGREWLPTHCGRNWLQTLSGRDWLQTGSGWDWLSAHHGRDWLHSVGGRDWLQTESGQDWLQTKNGQDWQESWSAQDWQESQSAAKWLQTQSGRDWLQTPAGRNWLQIQSGRDWLQSQGGRDWLQTSAGRDWLQIPAGRNWLQTQDGRDWLQTQGGRDWLQVVCGREWLHAAGGREWLQTQGGRDWVQTLAGKDWLQTGLVWLQTQSGADRLQIPGKQDTGPIWLETQSGQEWLETQSGREWLQTQSGQEWLQIGTGRTWLQAAGGRQWLQTPPGQEWLPTPGGRQWLLCWSGEHWLQTSCGRDWLQTQNGRDWLQTPHGQAWQSTSAASVWVRMEEFSGTLEAISEHIIVPELLLSPAFQVIQLYKSLPDFLMFPAFLALHGNYHPTCTLESITGMDFLYAFPALTSQRYYSSAFATQPHLTSNVEIINDIKAFAYFAREAHMRSRTASDDALKYACQNWAVHLSRAPNPWDERLNYIFKSFWNRHLLSWLERQWCLKDLRSCLAILSEGEKLVAKTL